MGERESYEINAGIAKPFNVLGVGDATRYGEFRGSVVDHEYGSYRQSTF